SLLRAGVENWLKGLIRFLGPRRVRVVKCIATTPEHFDPVVGAELGVEAEAGGRDRVRQTAADCDVLLYWGPYDLGAWLADCRPPVGVFVAHGEGDWTRLILDGCAPVTDHVVAVSRR